MEVESAQLPGCGDAAPIRANHHEICKFKTEKDDGYGLVVAAIRKVMLPTTATDEVRSTDRLLSISCSLLIRTLNRSGREQSTF